MGGVAVTLSSLPQYVAAPVDGGLTIATGAVTVAAEAAITTAGVTTAVNGALNTDSDFSDLVNKFKGGSSGGTGQVKGPYSSLQSDLSGEELVPSKQSKSGVTPPKNEAQIDHIEPKSNDGSMSLYYLHRMTKMITCGSFTAVMM